MISINQPGQVIDSLKTKPDTPDSQLKALIEAGFLDVDCHFKNGIFAAFGGKR